MLIMKGTDVADYTDRFVKLDTVLELTNQALLACTSVTDYKNLQAAIFGSYLPSNYNVFGSDASAPAATKALFSKDSSGANVRTGNYLGNYESVVFQLVFDKAPKSIAVEVSALSPVANQQAMMMFAL